MQCMGVTPVLLERGSVHPVDHALYSMPFDAPEAVVPHRIVTARNPAGDTPGCSAQVEGHNSNPSRELPCCPPIFDNGMMPVSPVSRLKAPSGGQRFSRGARADKACHPCDGIPWCHQAPLSIPGRYRDT